MKALNFFKKLIYKTTLFLAIIFLTAYTVYAQPDDPQLADPDNAVPIHGIIYLLIGGLIIGIKKIIGIKNKSRNW